MAGADVDAIELRTHASIRELEQHWPSLVTDDTPPFLSYAWLRALETTGCVCPERGWVPLFLSLWRGNALLAAAPAYVKGHSMGEFVFDQSWADFAERRLGVPYYPKLVVTVPFTPATGPRLLLSRDVASGPMAHGVQAAFADGLAKVVEHFELSGAHVLFVPEATAETMTEFGFEQRYGVQFHWRNAGYGSFEDFLARFPSKKRTQLRRERKEIQSQGLELEALTGADITSELTDHVFTFYKNTVERFYWGRQYLNREFFEEVVKTMPEQLHIVLARRKGGTREPVAGAFNLLGKRALYGRYWGAREEHRFLHFNVCFYEGISECIERGLSVFEPGAGGEHKLARGFEAALTHSVHRLRHPGLARAVTDYLLKERHAIGVEIEEAERNSLLRPLDRASKVCP